MRILGEEWAEAGEFCARPVEPFGRGRSWLRRTRALCKSIVGRSGVKPWSDTRSCQIALPLRPRPRPCSINSGYASRTLADGGEGSLGAPCFSEKGAIKPRVTVAGFASGRGSLVWPVLPALGAPTRADASPPRLLTLGTYLLSLCGHQ